MTDGNMAYLALVVVAFIANMATLALAWASTANPWRPDGFGDPTDGDLRRACGQRA